MANQKRIDPNPPSPPGYEKSKHGGHAVPIGSEHDTSTCLCHDCFAFRMRQPTGEDQVRLQQPQAPALAALLHQELDNAFQADVQQLFKRYLSDNAVSITANHEVNAQRTLQGIRSAAAGVVAMRKVLADAGLGPVE